MNLRSVAEPKYYGIVCKPLPTINTLWLNEPIAVPKSIDGPVLIGASNLSGVEFGPGPLDPYGQFKLLKAAAAISKVQKAQNLAQAKQLDPALQEARAAVALAPGCDSDATRVGRCSS